MSKKKLLVFFRNNEKYPKSICFYENILEAIENRVSFIQVRLLNGQQPVTLRSAARISARIDDKICIRVKDPLRKGEFQNKNSVTTFNNPNFLERVAYALLGLSVRPLEHIQTDENSNLCLYIKREWEQKFLHTKWHSAVSVRMIERVINFNPAEFHVPSLHILDSRCYLDEDYLVYVCWLRSEGVPVYGEAHGGDYGQRKEGSSFQKTERLLSDLYLCPGPFRSVEIPDGFPYLRASRNIYRRIIRSFTLKSCQTDKNHVLIILPVMSERYIELLNWALECYTNLNSRCKFFVKTHPRCLKGMDSIIKFLNPKFSVNFLVENDCLFSALDKYDNVVAIGAFHTFLMEISLNSKRRIYIVTGLKILASWYKNSLVEKALFSSPEKDAVFSLVDAEFIKTMYPRSIFYFFIRAYYFRKLCVNS